MLIITRLGLRPGLNLHKHQMLSLIAEGKCFLLTPFLSLCLVPNVLWDQKTLSTAQSGKVYQAMKAAIVLYKKTRPNSVAYFFFFYLKVTSFKAF